MTVQQAIAILKNQGYPDAAQCVMDLVLDFASLGAKIHLLQKEVEELQEYKFMYQGLEK